MSLADRLRAILYWPLKRHLLVQPFKVIARVGSTGNDETVLEPDEDKTSNDLDAVITPRRSGELMFYVNDAIWAFDGKRGSTFYDTHDGRAVIEVRQTDWVQRQ